MRIVTSALVAVLLAASARGADVAALVARSIEA